VVTVADERGHWLFVFRIFHYHEPSPSIRKRNPKLDILTLTLRQPSRTLLKGNCFLCCCLGPDVLR
jgi:hypothetical protein